MIQARNLYLTYDNNKYIIKQGNFSIKEGEFVFIGGNSGSGKSTLLKSFYGELPIRHGELNITKQSVVGIKGNKLRVLRKDIGIIFQDYNCSFHTARSTRIKSAGCGKFCRTDYC